MPAGGFDHCRRRAGRQGSDRGVDEIELGRPRRETTAAGQRLHVLGHVGLGFLRQLLQPPVGRQNARRPVPTLGVLFRISHRLVDGARAGVVGRPRASRVAVALHQCLQVLLTEPGALVGRGGLGVQCLHTGQPWIGQRAVEHLHSALRTLGAGQDLAVGTEVAATGFGLRGDLHHAIEPAGRQRRHGLVGGLLHRLLRHLRPVLLVDVALHRQDVVGRHLAAARLEVAARVCGIAVGQRLEHHVLVHLAGGQQPSRGDLAGRPAKSAPLLDHSGLDTLQRRRNGFRARPVAFGLVAAQRDGAILHAHRVGLELLQHVLLHLAGERRGQVRRLRDKLAALHVVAQGLTDLLKPIAQLAAVLLGQRLAVRALQRGVALEVQVAGLGVVGKIQCRLPGLVHRVVDAHQVGLALHLGGDAHHIGACRLHRCAHLLRLPRADRAGRRGIAWVRVGQRRRARRGDPVVVARNGRHASASLQCVPMRRHAARTGEQ